jgi:hypothetical protein
VSVLGGRGARVIGQNAHERSDRQIRRGRTAGARRHDAMFLVGAHDHQITKGAAVQVADDPVALVDQLRGGAAIVR